MQKDRAAQLRELQELVQVALGTAEFVNRLRAAGANKTLLAPVEKMAAETRENVRRTARAL